jgi:hypothetical protein
MKKKLALTFGSIQQLSKKEQKDVNGGWGGSCSNTSSCQSCSGNTYRRSTGSINHPCNSSSPYYQNAANCANYCMSGGYCCS